MKKISSISLTVFALLFSLTTFAKPMAQRNCHNQDLQILPDTNIETVCEWAPHDNRGNQVTLHTSLPIINATCIFTPSNTGEEKDAIVTVQGYKAAEVKNLLINDNIVSFIVYNNNSDKNINVVFYLNKNDDNYSPGDKIHCSFAAAPNKLS